MTYALEIPPEILGELATLRDVLGKSIRAMILEAIRSYIREADDMISSSE